MDFITEELNGSKQRGTKDDKSPEWHHVADKVAVIHMMAHVGKHLRENPEMWDDGSKSRIKISRKVVKSKQGK